MVAGRDQDRVRVVPAERRRFENWSYEIYVTDATGEVGPLVGATRLTTDATRPESGDGIEDSQVTWSPDGTRIAFLSTGRGTR